MEMTIRVRKIAILHRRGAVDYVWLHTDLPPPFPIHDQSPLVVTFELPIGSAEEYVRSNFGREPDEVING